MSLSNATPRSHTSAAVPATTEPDATKRHGPCPDDLAALRRFALVFMQQGNVAFVSTIAFWRPKEQSPSGQNYHWNSNAETYYLIGEAMGRAMFKLLEGTPHGR